MEAIEQLQGRQEVADAAWILFNMCLQHYDDLLEKKKKINDPFTGFPKKKRSIPQNPNSNWVSPMECGSSRVLCNMKNKKKTINDPFTGFLKKKRSIPQNPKWVSPMEAEQDMEDIARVLCSLEENEKKTNDPFLEFSHNPNLGPANSSLPSSSTSSGKKLKLKITFSGCEFPFPPPNVYQSKKSLIGIKRCHQIQEQYGGEDRVCKRQRTSKKVKVAISKKGGSSFVIQKGFQSSDTNREQLFCHAYSR